MRNKKLVLLLVLLLAISSLTACTLPGLGGSAKKGNIVIASGSITERQIMNEILKQMMEHHMPDVEVNMISNLGNTILINQALSRGDANISGVMYTGSSLTGELGMEPILDPIECYDTVVEKYKEVFERIWFPPYGFENTYAVMVTRELAEKENLTKTSDLTSIGHNLKCGADASWIQREGDGYEDFKRIYGFDFQNLYPMDIGLVYNAVESGEMDVVIGYSTDGRVASYDLVILEDDLRLFPPYDASPVASMEVIKKYPELIEVFLRLEGSIDNTQMQLLNRSSDEDLVEPHIIATDFLVENNYFEDVVIDPEEVKHYESY
ncbi:MAG: osmoprotectant ABC transporter substrate-binding protein [Tissierellia bacterium]|nr:osmoprotectant ABC transporter substrate-binding protein [Tissierellia bacterium]